MDISRLSIWQLETLFLPPLIFNWRTFSRRGTERWWRREQKIMCWPIRTRKIGGVRLQNRLYVSIRTDVFFCKTTFHMQQQMKVWRPEALPKTDQHGDKSKLRQRLYHCHLQQSPESILNQTPSQPEGKSKIRHCRLF